VEWLAEFLTPDFSTRDAGEPADGIVSLREDDGELAALETTRPVRPPIVDGVALDTGVQPLEDWSVDPLQPLFFDPAFGILQRSGREGRALTLVSASGNPKARIALMRVVREIAMQRAQRDGGLFLHASALAVAGRGLVIAGPKEAGKTTLLVHLLGRAAGARYLANDRVLIRLDGTIAHLGGMATIVSVRPGTLAMFPELARRLRDSGFHYARQLGEGAAPSRPDVPADGRQALSPAQFRRVLGVEGCREAVARAIVFPSVTRRAGGIELRRLELDEAAVQLGRSVFGRDTRLRSHACFALGDRAPLPDDGALEVACARLAAIVPTFECRLGLDAYVDTTSTERALATLLG
jgi:hypothetical protein